MPRERNPLIRRGGFIEAEKFYVLAYEGNVSEKKYFEDLRLSEYFNDSGSIETIALKKGKTDSSNPLSVKALLARAKQDYNFRPTDEFWLIIDRDQWETIHKINLEALYQDCQREQNFHIALSNPCFEMWLILHFKAVTEISDADKALLLENAATSAKHHFVDDYLTICMDNGRGYNKRPDPKIFLPRLNVAIENAEQASEAQEHFPKTLGSDVFKLVKKLIK